MVPGQLYFQLPSDFRPYAEVLSANAQMYLQCVSCGWEDRINILYGFPSRELLAEPCSQCGLTEHSVVRHMESFNGRCLDCGHELSGFETVPWEDLACPNCLSHRVAIEQVKIEPPYPSRFGEAGDRTRFGTEDNNFMRKDQPWGVDPGSDARHLQLEVKAAVHYHPADSPFYIACEFLFGQSLLMSNEYPKEDDNIPVLVNLQASMMHDRFRQVGELPAGLKALELHEIAAGIEKNPANKAAWEHNIAIVINSLLVKYSEAVIAQATERPEIRKEGISYAISALRFFEAGAAKDAEREAQEQEDEDERQENWTYSNQVARVYHLIGDLLRIGQASNEERRQALEAYSEALQWDMPENLVPILWQSRGETTLMLQDATKEELVSASEDLKAALSADTKRLGRSQPWALLWHMAQIAERLNDRATELQTLEKAARVAMAVVRQNLEEYFLQARTEPMAKLFDTLAHRYAQQGKSTIALSAAEALRAGTVRLHTKTKEQQFEDMLQMAKQSGADLARAHLRQAGARVSLADSLLSSKDARIDSIEPAVKRLLALNTGTPTALISVSNPVAEGDSYEVVTFVCGKFPKSKQQIKCKLVSQDLEGLGWDEALVRPGPFREQRLRRMHAKIGDSLVASVLPVLNGMGVKRIVFSLPGTLSPYAFEAVPAGVGKEEVLMARWEVGYVPAIAFALDHIQRTPTHPDATLLVVGYQGNDLTNAAHEVERLRELFGQRMTLLSGQDCTKAGVLEQLAKPYDYIHFVCHGTYDADMPLNAALHLVPDVEDDSQRVTAGDIFMNVKFASQPVVTMSACSTALMAASAVNNCHGLTGSLLRAGARGIVGSRWPVYDATSALFMSSFYEKILDSDESSPLTCLTAVQRELAKDHGIEDFASFGYMGIP